jgi:hypothetical protein
MMHFPFSQNEEEPHFTLLHEFTGLISLMQIPLLQTNPAEHLAVKQGFGLTETH